MYRAKVGKELASHGTQARSEPLPRLLALATEASRAAPRCLGHWVAASPAHNFLAESPSASLPSCLSRRLAGP